MASSSRTDQRAPPSSAPPNYRVPALEKGLDILEYLSEARTPLAQAELSRGLHRSASELFRVLASLEARGYIHRDEVSNKYELTLKLFELAHTHTLSERLLAAAREPMRRVAQELRESCHLGIVRDDRLVIFAQEESPEPIRISVEVGRTFPALFTASGRLLLAHLPADVLDVRLERSPEYRSMTDAERGELARSFSAIRQEGAVIAESDLVMGVQDTSVLIGSPRSGVTAALAVPILMTRGRTADTEAILSTLREHAAHITERLGLTP